MSRFAACQRVHHPTYSTWTAHTERFTIGTDGLMQFIGNACAEIFQIRTVRLIYERISLLFELKATSHRKLFLILAHDLYDPQ